MADVLIAFCTFPDSATADSAVTALVENGFVACGNILPPVRSIYRWQGKLENSEEVLVMFKLSSVRYAEFETKLQSLHPYELPEIIAFPVTHGLPAYLEWVTNSSN